MSDHNEQSVRRFFDEMCNKRQLDLADQLFSPDHVYHDPSSRWVGTGPAGMKELIRAYILAFGDALWDVNEVIEAGDKVITRWTGRGTHTADLMAIRATKKQVSVDGIWIHRFADGKIVESWNAWDMLGLLQQIGAVPPIGEAK